DVEAEAAAPGHHVDRAVWHFELAHRTDHVALLRRALLEIHRDPRHRGGGVAPHAHRRGAGVAGHAGDLAHVAQAAVDRRDDAQRQVELVQHRALLEVDLDETEVARWIAPDRGDLVAAQARTLHRIAHRDAVGVGL